MPASRAASRTVWPSRAVHRPAVDGHSRHRSCSSAGDRHSARGELVAEVPQARSPPARPPTAPGRRGTSGPSGAARLPARPRPRCYPAPAIRSQISRASRVPSRQGVHLPHDSASKKCSNQVSSVGTGDRLVQDEHRPRAERDPLLPELEVDGHVEHRGGTNSPAAPPVSATLNREPSRMPPPNCSMTCRSVMPSGASNAPGRLTQPVTVNTLVPGAVPRSPASGTSPRRGQRSAGRRHRVSTLLMSVGLP